MTSEHLAALLAEVQPLSERFRAAGWRIYLVGGIVRDQMLGRTLDDETDIDLTTDAPPPEIRQLISGWADAIWDQGERFGTVGCKVGDRSYELTTHRAEFYDPTSRKPDVVFSDDVTVDLSRRDFTVNAMALELPGGELIDPYDGVGDLEGGHLRTPLGAELAFSDDPLRMLRAARFASGYDLEPTQDIVDSMTAMADRLEIVAVERRRDELDKLLMLEDPTAGLRLLELTGVATHALPTRAALDVIAARLRVLPARLPLRIAALLVDDPGSAADHLEAMRFSNEQRRAVETITEAAVAARAVDPASDGDVRRFGRRAAGYAGDALLLAATLGDQVAGLEERWSELDESENLATIESPLDGAQVMTILGLDEGPVVGEAMSHLLELRLEEGPMNTATATRRLSAWWEAQPRNSSTS